MVDVKDETRVVLVDDDALVRMGLKAMLDGMEGIRVVAEASDGEEVCAIVADHRPHVVLMDLRMKNVDGITATRRIQDLAERPAVIVLTTFDDTDLVTSAISAGAIGFLLKHAPPEGIVRAITAARQGESLFSPEIAARLVTIVGSRTGDETEQSDARERLKYLTAREIEVAQEVAQGKPNAEIAAGLALTVPTIKSYISDILTKTNTSNRVQLAVLIHMAKLADPGSPSQSTNWL